MMEYEDVSPLDYRYYKGEPGLFHALKPLVSEAAYIQYQLRVESTLVKTMAKIGICEQEIADEVEKACAKVTVQEVYAEEEKTQHNIRALVNCVKSKLSNRAKPYVHLFVTSSDIMDTATAMRLKDLCKKALLPSLKELERMLIGIARDTQDIIQIGRTHGQHAEPITFGFTIAEYVDRIGNCFEKIKKDAENLRGKISGAVGAYNAFSLVSERYGVSPEAFEEEVLKQLGLKPGRYSTQIVEPEYVSDLVYMVISCFSVLANLCDDIRHLYRTELGEVTKKSEKERIGSSTMPHKVNPWNFEHIKSMWKAFMPRIITVLMDQISEHQRDLTNSASNRFIIEIFVSFIHSVNRLTTSLAKIEVNTENIKHNLDRSKDKIVAEPLYILLSIYGHPDGYGCVRKLLTRARKGRQTLNTVMWEDSETNSYLKKFSDQEKKILKNPETYIGTAKNKTEKICSFWENALSL